MDRARVPLTAAGEHEGQVALASWDEVRRRLDTPSGRRDPGFCRPQPCYSASKKSRSSAAGSPVAVILSSRLTASASKASASKAPDP